MNQANIYLHVYNRGVAGLPIFLMDENYAFLTRKMRDFLPKHPIVAIAYCLMPTHYHFLFQTYEQKEVSRFIQRLFNSYTQAFNKQNNRSGTLFGGRAKSKIVDSDEYALQLCRYIHLNPVQSGLVKDPADWEHSDYSLWLEAYTGTSTKPNSIQKFFPNANEYREFVALGSTQETGGQP